MKELILQILKDMDKIISENLKEEEISKSDIQKTSDEVSKIKQKAGDVLRDENLSNRFKYKKSGYMYLFGYNPPNRKESPVYDKFPLILVVQFSNNFIYGLNIHKLPLRERILLSIYLLKYRFDSRDGSYRAKINSLMGSRLISKYINESEIYYVSGVRTKIKMIKEDELIDMLFQPFEKFVGMSRSKVQSTTRKNIKNR
jgi:hypothetical protein